MPATSARADQVRSDEQQFLDALNIQQAWNVTKGAGARVAVLDSGVDGSQQDLTGSVTTGPDSGWFDSTVQPAGARTWVVNAAFRSGCSKFAKTVRA